jgi:hypothetical protein
MSEFTTFQDWTTLARATSGSEVQDLDSALDMGGEEEVTALVEISAVSSATVALETAVSLEGPWLSVKSWNTATREAVQLLTHLGAPSVNLLRRYVRWKVTTTGAGYACFRMSFAAGR